MTIEEAEQIIDEIIGAKKATIRNQKIGQLINGIPMDNTKIDEIEKNIEEVIMLATHKLETETAKQRIREIIAKYRV